MWTLYTAEHHKIGEDTCLLHFLQKYLFSRRFLYIVIERLTKPTIEISGMELYTFITGTFSKEYEDIWEAICHNDAIYISFSNGDYARNTGLPSFR